MDMRSRHPKAACVHFNLGHKFETLCEFRAALSAYRRFVSIAPRHPRRAAVDTRIRKLEAKLQ